MNNDTNSHISVNYQTVKTIESVMSWDKIIASVEEAKNLARPINYDYLDLL